MLNKDLKDVTDPALKKALENILGGKIQAQLEEKDKKKKNKKTKNLKIKKGKPT